MQVCTNCGAEVSPAGSCANCGASLLGGLRASQKFRNDSLVSAGRVVERSTDLDTLPIEKKRRYKVMAWTAATALGLTLVGIKSEAEWTGLAFMAFSLGLIVTGVYTGFADMKLRSAQAREAKRLWIMSCENRICAQCHTVLLPDASSCSSCGGVDLRIAAQGLHPEKTASKGLHPNKTAGKTTVEAAAYTAGAAAGWAAGLIRGVAKNLDNKH